MKDVSPYVTRGKIFVIPEPEDPLSNARLVQEQEAPNFRDYWQVVRKHKSRIAICFFGAVIGTAVIVFSMTPLYTARSTLVIEPKSPQVVNIQQVLSESIDTEDHNYYESQYEMLKSRSLAAQVIKELNLEKNPVFAAQDSTDLFGFFKGLWSRATAWMRVGARSTGQDAYGVDPGLINTYEGMLGISPIKRSRLVSIAFSTPVPSLSARLANAHANAYIHQGMQLRSRANQEAKKFLETKLAELKARVQHSEEALNQFRRGKGIISLDDKENIVVDRLADLNKDLTQAEADRIGLESQARLIKQRDYDSLPAVINNTLIQTLKAQVVNLESEYANLSAQFKSGYPRLAQLKAQLDEAKQRLAQQIKGVVEGINSAYYAAAGKEKELRVQMDKQKAAALALKDAGVEYAILSREANTNSQLYDSVLQRLKEISVTAEIPNSNISILDTAEIPTVPSSPQKRQSLLLGGLIGLLGGLGLAFLSEHLDNTLRTPEEVERYLGVANLVVVPDFFSLPKGEAKWKLTLRRSKAAVHPRMCLPNKSALPSNLRLSVITEAYRKLRTAIFLSRPDQPPKTILFTSSTAGEGKTITVANTAIMFAQLGHRVLVVDADLRRPSCHKALRVQNSKGLTDFLAGREDLQNAIKPTSIPNLSVLNCGTIAPNPTELIGSQKMRETLVRLKEHYDVIVIDSPPVMPVSDTILLSTMAEGVVFVVRGQETPRHVVKAALSQLKNDHTKLLGVVLNRVDIRKAEYDDYYQSYVTDYYSTVGLA